MNAEQEKQAPMQDTLPEAKTDSMAPLFWAMGVVLGVLSGVIHVAVQDPLLTALAVLFSTMVLGALRPARPWRWLLAVGVPLPVVMIAAKTTGHYANFTRATLAGAILMILPGVAGAFGGSLGRRLVTAIMSDTNSGGGSA